jgi:hypothetical protein
VALTTATTWDLAIVGHSADVAIGEVLLIGTARTLNASWGLKRGVAYPIDEQRTELDVPLIYELGVRSRSFDADVKRETDRADVEALVADARGRARAWWLVPDDSVNDSIWARFTSPAFSLTRQTPRTTSMSIDVEEAGLGPAL